jgi:hypothetical protein
MAEITRPHSSGDYQIVEWDLSYPNTRAVGFDGPGVQVDTGNFRQHHGKVLLPSGELPNRRGNL